MAPPTYGHPNSGITVQLCGDAHILNFGLWNTPSGDSRSTCATSTRRCRGRSEWDLKRYLASIVVLARENGLRNRAAREAVRLGYRGYRQWIRKYADWPELDIWYDVVGTDRFANYAQRGGRPDHRQAPGACRHEDQWGAFDKLTAVKGGRRRIAEKPPYRTHKLTQHALERGCHPPIPRLPCPTTCSACSAISTSSTSSNRSSGSAASGCGCSCSWRGAPHR